MEQKVRLEIKKIREGAVLPFYARPGDAGMDLCAAEAVLLQPEETVAVPTGLVMQIPPGYEVQIRPRSGLSLHTRLRLPNSPGTIDSGYKDELKILLYNASPLKTGGEVLQLDVGEKQNRGGAYQIRVGDRIAQMVLAPVSQGEPVAVTEFSEGGTQNRGGGFGSSGLRREEAL